MEIISLKYVLELSRLKNFSATAHECSISQSSLTKHIQKVENEIGLGKKVELFNRNSRPVTLTTAGKEFIQYAESIVNDYENMMKSMDKYSSAIENMIFLGIIPVLKHLGMVELLNDFRSKENEHFEFEIQDRPSRELLRMLDAGELDAAIVVSEKGRKESAGFTFYNFKDEEMVAVVNKLHPFAARRSVSLREIANTNLILLDQETGIYNVVINAFRKNGIEPPVNIKTRRNVNTIIDNMSFSDNHVVSIFSRAVAKANLTNYLSIVEIDEYVGYNLAIAVQNRRRINPVLKRLIAFALEWNEESKR